MPILLFIATSIGMFIVTQSDGRWEIVGHSLQGRALTSIAATSDAIIIGTSDGLWRSGDRGVVWQQVGLKGQRDQVRWIASSKSRPSIILAGMEPAGILMSQDGGLTWSASAEIEKFRDSNSWYLPYSPRAGCVRGFAISEDGQKIERIYAAAEVGGVLVSNGVEKPWQLVDGSDGRPDYSRDLKLLIHPDVHSISVHPSSADRVTAPTGGGLYRSTDGGKTWRNIYDCYIRAAWVDPEDVNHIIAGPADGVSRNGRIEETHDGGKTWQRAPDGMHTPWANHMVERFFQANGHLYAILSNGELWVKLLKQKKWRHILKDIGQANAMASI